MRDIRFKFWLGHTKKMTYDHSLTEICRVFPEFTEDMIPLQYTGLSDSEGNEIWEGDIFLNGESIRIVEFSGGNFRCIRPDRSAAILLSFVHDQNKNRVLGNIYQNPELLTETEVSKN